MNRLAFFATCALSAAFIAASPLRFRARPSNSAASERERSIAAFREVATVLQSPRCMNCHVAGDRPRQGDDRHIHAQNVVRGPDGKGLPGLMCLNCHQDRNQESAGGPPGAPDWQMPPAAQPMAWEGLSVGDLCRSITDPKRNGNRKVADLIPHMRTSLVMWAWAPGPERAAPPVSYDEFTAKVQEWAETGAVCEK
jgi:hypothetical protein